jgi:hypothetical protein
MRRSCPVLLSPARPSAWLATRSAGRPGGRRHWPRSQISGLAWAGLRSSLGLITSGRCLLKATSQASLRLRRSLTHSPARDDQASREKFRDDSRMCGIAGPWCAVPRSCTITLPGAQQKIVLGGNLGGKLALVKAIPGQFPPARASFTAGQAIYGVYRDRPVVHGKEKVYGSIP